MGHKNHWTEFWGGFSLPPKNCWTSSWDGSSLPQKLLDQFLRQMLTSQESSVQVLKIEIEANYQIKIGQN